MTTTPPDPTAAPPAAAGSNASVDLLLGAAGLGSLGSYVGSGSGDTAPVPARIYRAGEGTTRWGYSTHSLLEPEPPGSTVSTKVRPRADVYLDVQRFTDAELDTLARRLVGAGLLTEAEVSNRAAIEKAWTDLVDKSAVYHSANPTTNLTPEDMIDLYGNGGTPGHPKITEVVNREVNIASADQARGLLEAMMHDALGRAPTGREADDFQAALNDAQTKNPAITTQSVSYDAAGNPTTNTTKSGGLDAQGFAKDYAQSENHDEYAAYQSATTYYRALLDAISSPVPIPRL